MELPPAATNRSPAMPAAWLETMPEVASNPPHLIPRVRWEASTSQGFWDWSSPFSVRQISNPFWTVGV